MCQLILNNITVVGDKSLKDKNIRSKHRKGVPFPYFARPVLRQRRQLLVGKCPKPSEWKGAFTHERTKKNGANQVQSNGSGTGFNTGKMKLIPTRNMAAYLRKIAIDGISCK